MPCKVRQLKADLRKAGAYQVSQEGLAIQPIQYSMLIEWSEQDQAYLVTLPEWAQQVYMPATHGDTYDEAVKNGQEVLEMLIQEVYLLYSVFSFRSSNDFFRLLIRHLLI